MPGEPRRSGRATKGQHARTHSETEEPSTKRRRGKGNVNAEQVQKESEEDEEDDAIVRCVCGLEDDDDGGRMMICCDNCSAWQHNDCMGVTENANQLPESYMCEVCKPEDHKDLLEAMAKGERPWEAIAKRRAEEKKTKKRKGGRRGRLSKQSQAEEQPSNSHDAENATDAQRQSPLAHEEENKDIEPLKTNISKPVTENISDSSTPGEKRRKSESSKPDEHVPKRRKSTTTEYQSRERDLSPYRRKSIEYIQSSISGLIRLRAKEGNYRIPDGDTADSLSLRLAYDIETSMVKCMKHNSTYKEKVRSIVFNVKKNQMLLDKLLQGTLSTDDLVQMSTDDMASEELQRQMAVMKEEADKQAILIKEEGPRIRKTHKGEEIIGDDSLHRALQIDGSVINKPTEGQKALGNGFHSSSSPINAQHSPPLDISGNPISKRALRVNTSAPLRSVPHERRSSETFNLQKVWSSAQSPGSAGFRPPQHPVRHQDLTNPPHTPPLAEDDAEIDRLLKDEENESPPYSPTSFADPSIVWNGRLTMTNLISAHAHARFIAGGDIGRKIPWTEIIPQDILISGRIGTSTADEYVASMRHTSTTDVACLSIDPVDEKSGRPQLERLFSYLHQRSRWGVISDFTHPAVKDIYVVPIETGTGELPKFIGFLDNCTLESFRPKNMIVLTLIVKTQSPVQPATDTPLLSETSEPRPSFGSMSTMKDNNQIVPMLQGHQVSPFEGSIRPAGASDFTTIKASSAYMDGNSSAMQPEDITLQQKTSQSLSNPSASKENAAAISILGPFVNLPIVNQLLSAQMNVTEHQMRNLRDILERVPAARNDLSTFQAELFKTNVAAQQQ